MSRIFILDDDQALCRSLEIQLKEKGHEVRYAGTVSGGMAALDEYRPDLIFLDLYLPDGSGIDVLKELKENQKDLPAVMITGAQDMKTTIEAMRAGAFDYIRKPLDFDDVLLVIEKIARFQSMSRSKAVKPAAAFFEEKPREIVGSDKKIVEMIKRIGLLSRSRSTVLIEGESGTGKELVARALHDAACPDEPFVAINCSAVVPTLPESELFGYERGAFTGADRRKIGKLEYAADGTAFFDEIGDMSLDLQSKILRVFQEREFQRVGGLESIPFRARIITATNRNLDQMVREGTFRRDLYYRIAVSSITLPPLRERRGDIELISRHLIPRISREIHRPVRDINVKAVRLLESYDWPGNVRELENVLTRAVTLARGDILTAEDLDFSFGPVKAHAPGPSRIVPLQEAEIQHIERALAATGWNISQTAKALRISPTTLRQKIRTFNLKRPGHP